MIHHITYQELLLCYLKKAQYSILALVKLAKEYKNGPVLISSISQTERIPKNSWKLSCLILNKQECLAAKKGKGEDIFSLKSPDEINLADIIRHIDGAIALIPCVTFKYYQPCLHCKDEMTCGIRSIVKDIRDETVNILKNITLSDILAREEKLIKNQVKSVKLIIYYFYRVYIF
ncbi:MAG: Rrf2 family transcriptional regulator [Sphingobacterium sp.]|nr:Rrf2 family transcriptional regulator [Sphingobacterium sp.]